MTQLASKYKDVECVGEYLSKCPYAEHTQIHDVFDDGDVYILTVGMAVRKDELTKMPDDVEKTKQEVNHDKSYKVSFRPSDAVYEYVVEADDEIEAEDKAYEMLREAIGWDAAKDWYLDGTEEIDEEQNDDA